MKLWLLTIFIAMFCLAVPALGLTPTEKVIVQHIGDVNKRQASELNDQKAKVVWLDKELKDLQPKIDQIGKERDGWQAYGNDQHDKWMNAEKRVADKEAAILRRDIVIGIMGFLMLGYIAARIWLKSVIPWIK